MNEESIENIVQIRPKKISELLEREFFEIVPFNVAVIGRDFRIVAANKNFEEYFGDWRGKHCFEVYKKSATPCIYCRINEVYEEGKVIVSNEAGIDKNNKPCHYVVHVAPLKEKTGEVSYVIEMSTDITEVGRYQREYNILFEKVPSYITVIDKNFKVIRANKKFRDTFGDIRGKFCYEVYKKRRTKCKNCPAAKTFQDGKEHVSTEIGLTQSGDESHYVISTTPLSTSEKGVELIIEIATDITEINQLQDQLHQAHDFYATLIQNSAHSIIAVNDNWDVQIFNPAARKLFDWRSQKKPGLKKLKEMMPREFFAKADKDGKIAISTDTYVITTKSEKIPVRVNAVELKTNKSVKGRVIFISDQRELKKLEREKLDAERLGAVGQTVAGLAHTIKNLLMGLEGGMYMVDTGLRKGDATRIIQGWEVLQRNFNKTTNLVKDFLSFAKGRLPEQKIIDPNYLVKSIIELYRDAAAQQGVKLSAELDLNLKPAPLDPGGIEACLTNLVSNAIDAAMLRENGNGEVLIKTIDKDDCLIFEVVDNGVGMDSEVIQKVFTTFFTTKGGKGTGLGLLTTRKIVQEHGGVIEVDSELDKGSTFRIRFSRERLNLFLEEYLENINNQKGS